MTGESSRLVNQIDANLILPVSEQRGQREDLLWAWDHCGTSLMFSVVKQNGPGIVPRLSKLSPEGIASFDLPLEYAGILATVIDHGGVCPQYYLAERLGERNIASLRHRLRKMNPRIAQFVGSNLLESAQYEPGYTYITAIPEPQRVQKWRTFVSRCIDVAVSERDPVVHSLTVLIPEGERTYTIAPVGEVLDHYMVRRAYLRIRDRLTDFEDPVDRIMPASDEEVAFFTELLTKNGLVKSRLIGPDRRGAFKSTLRTLRGKVKTELSGFDPVDSFSLGYQQWYTLKGVDRQQKLEELGMKEWQDVQSRDGACISFEYGGGTLSMTKPELRNEYDYIGQCLVWQTGAKSTIVRLEPQDEAYFRTLLTNNGFASVTDLRTAYGEGKTGVSIFDAVHSIKQVVKAATGKDIIRSIDKEGVILADLKDSEILLAQRTERLEKLKGEKPDRVKKHTFTSAKSKWSLIYADQALTAGLSLNNPFVLYRKAGESGASLGVSKLTQDSLNPIFTQGYISRLELDENMNWASVISGLGRLEQSLGADTKLFQYAAGEIVGFADDRRWATLLNRYRKSEFVTAYANTSQRDDIIHRKYGDSHIYFLPAEAIQQSKGYMYVATDEYRGQRVDKWKAAVALVEGLYLEPMARTLIEQGKVSLDQYYTAGAEPRRVMRRLKAILKSLDSNLIIQQTADGYVLSSRPKGVVLDAQDEPIRWHERSDLRQWNKKNFLAHASTEYISSVTRSVADAMELPLMDHDQLQDLFSNPESVQACQDFIRQSCKLVATLAANHSPKPVGFYQLVEEGLIGVWRTWSSERSDSSDFQNILVNKIQAELDRAIHNPASVKKLPTDLNVFVQLIDVFTKQKRTVRFNSEQDLQIISKGFGRKIEDIRTLDAKIQVALSLLKQ